MDWTCALSDNGELHQALHRLMVSVKADAAVISRRRSKDDKIKYIARCGVQSGKLWGTQPNSHAEHVLRDCVTSAKTGSIWKWSDVGFLPSDVLPSSHRTMPVDLFEVVVCPLEVKGSHLDCLELHYRHQPKQYDLDLLTNLLGTFASCWERRSPGLITKKIVQNGMPSCVRSRRDDGLSLLDVENPAKLSRSEFRVCTLLREGMTVNVIAENLSIGPATVRSHLSSIFSKTGASSQIELLHKLNCSSEPAARPERENLTRIGGT